MKFIKILFVLLKDTTWPNRKERWKNFISVIEYTAFFVALIYLFDKVIARGLLTHDQFLLRKEARWDPLGPIFYCLFLKINQQTSLHSCKMWYNEARKRKAKRRFFSMFTKARAG